MAYIYFYLDPRKQVRSSYDEIGISFLYEPIYVGKGKGNRLYDHLYQAKTNRNERNNLIKFNKLRSILKSGQEPIIFKYIDNMNEDEAIDLEKKIIANIGRIDLGTGTLTNMTDGGGGTVGFRFTKEQKEYLSKLKKGKNISPEHKEKVVAAVKRRWKDPVFKAKMSQANTGKKMPLGTYEKTKQTIIKNGIDLGKGRRGKKLSEETKKQMSISMRKKKTSAEDVKLIRNKYSSGARPTDLCVEFGLTRRTISKIIHFRVWKNVK